MKKLVLLFIGVISMPFVNAQGISDAVRYSSDEIMGTARFRALSGAFGALGGDMSAVSLNPAGSAVFNYSNTSLSISNMDIENETSYFNGVTTNSESNFDFVQAGAAFVFNNRMVTHLGENLFWDLLMTKQETMMILFWLLEPAITLLDNSS